MTDSDREPRDENLAQWLADLEFTDEQWEQVKRRKLEEETEQGHRLFGDQQPFNIPDTDTDA